MQTVHVMHKRKERMSSLYIIDFFVIRPSKIEFIKKCLLIFNIGFFVKIISEIESVESAISKYD